MVEIPTGSTRLYSIYKHCRVYRVCSIYKHCRVYRLYQALQTLQYLQHSGVYRLYSIYSFYRPLHSLPSSYRPTTHATAATVLGTSLRSLLIKIHREHPEKRRA